MQNPTKKFFNNFAAFVVAPGPIARFDFYTGSR
jgi:hypothetical protein